MKILLITDQHFGVRNDNQFYISYYKKFYENLVIPYIKQYDIQHVIALGDTFDKRRSINFMSLEAAKDMWFTPLEELGVTMHMLVGNHDIYYRNTLRINAPSELLGQYNNITVVEHPTTVTIGDLDILLLPWICDENRDRTFREIQDSTADVCMGHLEFNGFEAHPGAVMTMGMDHSLAFGKFKKVFSGHFHMKSNKDNIYYLGNPYQLYWNDYGCKRGFTVLDTETLKTTFYRNPYEMFHKIYYRGEYVEVSKDLEGSYVKLIVEDKGDQAVFDSQVRDLQNIGLADLKIVEDMSIQIEDGVDVLETEDTLTMLESYIDEVGPAIKVDASSVKNIIKSLYIEACEV